MNIKLLSPLHPLRIQQTDPSFKRRVHELRTAAPQLLGRIKSKDGAGVEFFKLPTKLPLCRGMSFDQLQNVIGRICRDDLEAMSFARFWHGPRQIFQFDPGLAEMLAQTEVDDVPWDTLHFPFEEFYLHFGCVLESQLEMRGRIYKAEGAYVRVQSSPSLIEGFLPGAIHITIATRLVHPSHEEVMAEMLTGQTLFEPLYNITISGAVGQTVAQALERGRTANLEHSRRVDEQALEQALRLADQAGVSLPPNPASTHLGEQKYLRGEVITVEAINLVFNCIAYLTAVPQEQSSEFPPEAPQSLIEKIENAPKPNKLQKLLRNMDELGFTRVHFVRDPSPRSAEESIPTGRTIRAHWRRGHWRSQACGTGWVRRVLTWIRPSLVNAVKEEPPSTPPGHVYRVETDPPPAI